MFSSNVDLVCPENPLEFALNSGDSKQTLQQIIANTVPQLNKGSKFTVSPPLWSGHTQTWYTAIRKFEDRDLVHYGRRLIDVDPDNSGYDVNGDNLLYDKFKGKSTFTIDYVVSPDHSSKAEIPESQSAKDLPPRTQYITGDEELKIMRDLEKPLLVALHGLSGGSHELYLRAMISEITEKHGFDALVVNSRGCAGHIPTTPQLFNGLWTNDVRYVINEHIPSLNPNKPIYMVGFSLGGAILSNFLGQEGEQVSKQIRGACALAAPWDFVEGSAELENSFLGYHVYSPAMLKSLSKLVDTKYQSLSTNPVVSAIGENSNFPLLRDFDDALTLKMFGFQGASDYYRHALPVQRLGKVRVPLLILLSLDDPIVGTRALPYSEVKYNPFVNMATTSCGGHIGWFDWKGERWYPLVVSKLFSELHKNWTWTRTGINPPSPATNWKHDRIIQ